MHEKVKYHLRQFKENIVKECCGKGCMKCSIQFEYVYNYALAGIPVKYWKLDMDLLDEKATSAIKVKKYLTKLKQAYNDGIGVFLCGKNGNGKTLSACAIGKAAIRQGYSVRFTFLGDIISAFINTMYDTDKKEQLQEDILGVDFLIIDDLDKAYISEKSKYVNSILDNLFRIRVQNNLPVIMTANKLMKDILKSDEEVFSKSLLSLFSESLLSIVFSNGDIRSELKKENMEKFFGD